MASVVSAPVFTAPVSTAPASTAAPAAAEALPTVAPTPADRLRRAAQPTAAGGAEGQAALHSSALLPRPARPAHTRASASLPNLHGITTAAAPAPPVVRPPPPARPLGCVDRLPPAQNRHSNFLATAAQIRAPFAPTAATRRQVTFDFAAANRLPPLVRHPAVWVTLTDEVGPQLLQLSGDVMARQSELWANLLADGVSSASGAGAGEGVMSVGRPLPPACWYAVLAHMHEVAPCQPMPATLVEIHAAVDFLIPQPAAGGASLRALAAACEGLVDELAPEALAHAYARALEIGHPAMATLLANALLLPQNAEAVGRLALAEMLRLLGPDGHCTTPARRARLVLGWIERHCPDEVLRPAFVRQPGLAPLRALHWWPPGHLRACARRWGLLPPLADGSNAGAGAAAQDLAATGTEKLSWSTPWLLQDLRQNTWISLGESASRRLFWLRPSLLAASQGPQLALIDVAAGRRLPPLQLGHGTALACAWQDGLLECVTNEGCLVQADNGEAPPERLVLSTPAHPYAPGIRSAAIAPHWLAMGHEDGKIALFARGEYAATGTLTGPRSSISHLQFSAGDLIGCADGSSLWRWDVITGARRAMVELPRLGAQALNVDALGVVVGGRDGNVRVYDRQKPSFFDRRVDPAGVVVGLPPDLTLADGWQTPMEWAVTTLACSADHVAAATAEAVVVLDRRTGRQLRILPLYDWSLDPASLPARVTALAIDRHALAVAITSGRHVFPSGRMQWAHHLTTFVPAGPGSAADVLPFHAPKNSWRWPWAW